MANMEGRKRKMKFDPFELEVLIHEAGKHLNEIQNRHMTIAKRNAIWEEISGKVNAVGKKMRSVDEVKRRYQDFRRRTREKMAERKKTTANKTSENNTSSPSIKEQAQFTLENGTGSSSIEEPTQFTFEDQVTGITEYDTVSIKAEQDDQSYTEEPPEDPVTSAEPQNDPKDIGQELLREQQKQSAALQTIAREMRATSSLARAARRDTQSIAAHCRQMVSAVSALTMAINSISKVIQDGMQAMAAINAGTPPGGQGPPA
ncbi:myb-related transcription factor, partner of profilin-like [Synchiropus splendidus]|uniref:myb-related transcription factor, partner of profilin-like n=1 Tax=Synchiropus splendidus TaxID=270530 RepID=UPI00237DD550|nr:myb-related transcription factor, partner of profilin-like [Synchiropus splendidus]